MAAESEWKVFFEGDFWYHSGRDHAGKELRTEKEFEPAAYVEWLPVFHIKQFEDRTERLV